MSQPSKGPGEIRTGDRVLTSAFGETLFLYLLKSTH